MMAWRNARSLDVLRDEIRSLYPGTTFWTIGNEEHRQGWSDHNPNECCDVVCAADILDNAGLDLGWLADTITEEDPPALKYVIYRDRIWFPGLGWQPYRGRFHTHVHVSVGWGPDGRSTGPYDDASPWGLLEEDDMPDLNDIRRVVREELDRPVRRADGKGEIKLTSSSEWSRHHAGDVKADVKGKVLPALASIQAAVSGHSAVEAVQAVIREEFAALGPALAAELGDVPQARIETALRAVLGSLDEQ